MHSRMLALLLLATTLTACSSTLAPDAGNGSLAPRVGGLAIAPVSSTGVTLRDDSPRFATGLTLPTPKLSPTPALTLDVSATPTPTPSLAAVASHATKSVASGSLDPNAAADGGDAALRKVALPYDRRSL
jgi:hypothetical protein